MIDQHCNGHVLYSRKYPLRFRIYISCSSSFATRPEDVGQPSLKLDNPVNARAYSGISPNQSRK